VVLAVDSDNISEDKITSEVFNNVHNYLIGSIIAAVKKVNDFLEGYEFLVKIFSNNIEGEARDFAFEVLKLITSELDFYDYTSDVKRIALLGTGELTVKVKGEGVGGRNQEFLLSFLNLIKEKPINHEFTMIGVNLDGIEGNSDAMGALVDNQVYQMMLKEDLNPESFLNNNDSNTFFKSIGTEIITGPTGANVNDLVLILLEFN